MMEKTRMNKYAKWIVLGLFVALIGGGVVRALNRRSQAAGDRQEPQPVTVTRGDTQATVEASGRVVSLSEARLAFDVPGRIAAVLVKEGQQVQKGEALVRLETATPERAVESAEQTLAMQEANLAELQRGASAEEIAAAEAAVASAQAQLDQLLNGPRPEEIAAAEANLKAAQASLWAAAEQRDQIVAGATEAEIAAARAQVASAQTQQKVARDAHDRTMACRTVTLPTGEEQEICPGLGTAEEQARYNLHAADEALAAAQAQLDQLLAGPTEEQSNAAQANVSAATAQRDAAQAQLDLLRAGSTPAQIAAARAQLAQAQASLETLRRGASEERLAVAAAQVEQARIALKEARDNLAGATLSAPFDGTVTRLLLEAGEWTVAGNPVATLSDLSAVEVELMVDEIDIGQIGVGQSAVVTLETWPGRALSATVARIAPAAEVQTGLVTYRVYLSLDAQERTIQRSAGTDDTPVIRPDMTANAEIVTQQRTDVLLVPNRAVQADRTAGRYSVERLSRGSSGSQATETVTITIGLRDAAYTEVLSGLREGDVVLIRPVQSQKPQEPLLPGARRLFGGE
jgi:HlyD family secretion protein